MKNKSLTWARPNNLAPKQDKMGINILGTAAQNIDRAEASGQGLLESVVHGFSFQQTEIEIVGMLQGEHG